MDTLRLKSWSKSSSSRDSLFLFPPAILTASSEAARLFTATILKYTTLDYTDSTVYYNDTTMVLQNTAMVKQKKKKKKKRKKKELNSEPITASDHAVWLLPTWWYLLLLFLNIVCWPKCCTVGWELDFEFDFCTDECLSVFSEWSNLNVQSWMLSEVRCMSSC